MTVLLMYLILGLLATAYVLVLGNGNVSGRNVMAAVILVLMMVVVAVLAGKVEG